MVWYSTFLISRDDDTCGVGKNFAGKPPHVSKLPLLICNREIVNPQPKRLTAEALSLQLSVYGSALGMDLSYPSSLSHCPTTQIMSQQGWVGPESPHFSPVQVMLLWCRGLPLQTSPLKGGLGVELVPSQQCKQSSYSHSCLGYSLYALSFRTS